MDFGTHLSGQEVDTDALLKNEAKTQEIARVTIGSNKICIREGLAQDNMLFSEESSRAFFEMDNAELIELRNPRFNVHHVCITYWRAHLSVCVEH